MDQLPGLILRVLTVNIHHGEGSDGHLDLDRLGALIDAAHPDVVALQEVDRRYGPRSDHADQAWQLGRSLGMTTLFGAGLRLPPSAPGQAEREYGVALLTRLPVRSWHRVPLPTWPGHEPRAMLLADLEAGPSGVRIGCAHLSVESAEARLAQARLIARTAIDAPTVLLGDLNADPDSAELAVLTEQLSDCWAAAGAGAGPTYPDDEPCRRIDYVLASGELETVEIEVLPVEQATDHRAVRATLRLGGG